MATGVVGPNGVLAAKHVTMAHESASEDALIQDLGMVEDNALAIRLNGQCAFLGDVGLVSDVSL